MVKISLQSITLCKNLSSQLYPRYVDRSLTSAAMSDDDARPDDQGDSLASRGGGLGVRLT